MSPLIKLVDWLTGLINDDFLNASSVNNIGKHVDRFKINLLYKFLSNVVVKVIDNSIENLMGFESNHNHVTPLSIPSFHLYFNQHLTVRVDHH